MADWSVVNSAARNGLCDYSLQLNRWFLKPIGAWPSSSSTSRLDKIVSHVLTVICYFFILFTVIPCIFHVLLEDESLHLKLKVLGPLSHWFMGGINYTTLLLRSKEIRYCMEHMKADWRMITRVEDQKLMLKSAKIGRYVAASCAAFMQGGVLCYCVIMAFTLEAIEAGNETRTIRTLPCAAYKKLIPVDTSPTNEIVLVSQFVSGFIVNSSVVGAFSLAAVFAAHACGQLNIVMKWITEFVNEAGDYNSNVEFNQIGLLVEHHLRALRNEKYNGMHSISVYLTEWADHNIQNLTTYFVILMSVCFNIFTEYTTGLYIRNIGFSFVWYTEKVMHIICLVELIGCTFNMCMLEYYCLTEKSKQATAIYALVYVSMTFNIFVFCYIGEILSEQCKEVGRQVYKTEWYRLPSKRVLDLLMIISRSNIVTQITAGKLVQMSMATFADVFKTSFAYFNMIRTMTM